MNGFGSITWWGFTPSLDLQDKDFVSCLQNVTISSSTTPEVNILLIGGGDCRHVLQTLARAHRHPHAHLNFYIVESQAELYARQLLMLLLAAEPQASINLQEKSEMLLEILGNTLVREQTMDYVKRQATFFIKLVTDPDYQEKIVPFLDLSNLKFKERDFLEAVFKFWRSENSGKSVFDVAKCWDLRLRQYLGDRYDAIPNVFDWDLSMKLSPRGADIIHTREYNEWRHKGVAFSVREATYDAPNRTLASGRVFKHEGERLARRGYWGDIIVSPYITIGITSEEKRFFKKSNNVYTHGAQHVAEYNMVAMLHEFEHRTLYVEPEENDKKATLTEITEDEEEEDNDVAAAGEPAANETNKDQYKSIDLPDVRVIFLPLNSACDLHKKSKFHNKFDIAYFANSLVHNLTPEISQTFTDRATVIAENARYMLELTTDQIKEFGKKITTIAVNAGCQVTEECGPDDSFAIFNFTRTKDT